MIEREHVVALLRKRFPGAAARQIAEAANAIVALPDEWEEIPVKESRETEEIRIFKRRDLKDE